MRGTIGRTDVRTLLIVDDNTFNLDFIGALLGSLGYATIAAGNGKDALRLVTERRPDAVIMDIELGDELGDESGIDVTRALKANPATAKIPVIALTGLDVSEMGSQLDAGGFSAIVRKPASIGALKSVLARVFGT
jgi:two-component system cell cycle response regulator DivK